MLRRTGLAHAGNASRAFVQSGLTRVRPSSQSILRSSLPRSQKHFISSQPQTPQVLGTIQKPEAQPQRKPLGEAYAAAQLGKLHRVTPGTDGQTLEFVFENRNYSHIALTTLRDACPCVHCVSESSGQKKFATCDIDAPPRLQSSKITEDGSLELIWSQDFMSGASHTSTYSLPFLQRWFVYKALPELYIPERYLWDRAAFEKNMEARTINYDAWMAGGEPFAKSLLDLCQWGLIVVKGVPETKDAVKEIANMIGNLQSTFYGETWDVISKPNAENVAYTNEFLCLHQDLMYNKEIPHVQLLHCMKNDCQGGDSLFSDGLRTAAEFKHRNPIAYSVLVKGKVQFQYSRNGHFYRRARAVITEYDREKFPSAVHWSPPFQGPFPPEYSPKVMSAWKEAAKAFKASLESPENMLQYRLQPGDCVLFDNSRVLHGRTKFDTSSGLRHLHGTYVNSQALWSALRREIEQGYIRQVKNHSAARAAEREQAITWFGTAVI